MINQPNLSLSDFIGLSAVQSRYEHQKASLLPIAKALSGIQRHSYDQNFLDVVKLSEATPIEAMIKQLAEIPPPFRSFWLEGPAIAGTGTRDEVAKYRDPETAVYNMRSGFLVRYLPKDKGFVYTSCDLNHFTQEMWDDWASSGAIMGLMLKDDTICQVGRSKDVTVTPERMIEINDDEVMAELEHLQAEQEILHSTGVTDVRAVDENIDQVFAEASFVTRAIIVLAAGYATPETSMQPAGDPQKEIRTNLSRMADGKRPLLPTTPIVTDIAKIRYLQKQPLERQQLLLTGVTQVKTYKRTSKLGLLHTVPSHKRRIVSPVDRTLAPRVLTSSQPVTVSLREGMRPLKTRLPLGPSSSG